MTKGFLRWMRLDETGPDRWRAAAPECASRGMLAAQAMVAAGRSTDTRWRWVHSAHIAYLAEGDPSAAVEYQVDRLLDTESTTTRLVRAVQGNQVLATALVGFQAPRRGLGPVHQSVHPGDLPDPHSRPAYVPDGTAGVPLDVRCLDRPPWEPAAGPEAANRMWVRFTEEIPDEILLHAAAIVFAADLLLVEPVAPPASGEWTDLDSGRGLRAVALDLSVRFHRGFRADDWVLHEHRSPSIADYRAYTTGQFHSSMGRLIASVSQETALLPAPVAASPHHSSKGR